jgi:hypothetical protein
MMMQPLIDIMPTGGLKEITWSFKHEIWFSVKLLCYAIAGLLGLVSALRIYNLWNVNGRHHVHIDAQVISWTAAAIFLVVATAFINMTLM